MAFVHAGGTIVERWLAVGEELRVDTGCLAAFSTTVDYNIQFLGGFKNALFGGEGLFLAKLTGPGCVYLQSLPFSGLPTVFMRLPDFIVAEGNRVGSEQRSEEDFWEDSWEKIRSNE